MARVKAPPLPDWVQAILEEDDEPLPSVSRARRASLDGLPSDRKRLIVVVSLYGPIRVRDAIRLAVPGATRDQSTSLAASMANLAAEGFIDRIAPGLYDAVAGG